MKKSLILFIMMFSCYVANAQRFIHGIVYELETNGTETPLVGANVVWINKQTGVSTNSKGEFLIKADGISDQRLIVSFVGLQSDTVLVKNTEHVKVVLTAGGQQLKEVVVSQKRESTMISVQPRKIEILNSGELKKAACCNLGESFQTNTTVDVTYRDGVTGSKELQVLGLAGSYTQLLTESAPLINGWYLRYPRNAD
jgi:hypothetical protein